MALSPYARYGQSNLTGISQAARKHTVVAGEQLPAIAADEFPQSGYDSELWRQIAEYNNIDDLYSVAVGTVLLIPPPQSTT